MSRFYTGLRDVQLDAPISCCPRCGSEIYGYDDVAALDSGLVHNGCMKRWEREEFSTYPACSFFLEGC